MHQGRAQTVACALGFFSIGLGLVELVAPGLVRQLSGARVSSDVIRAYGVREIATGVGILIAWKRAPWMWARVAGDALDIASVRTPAAAASLAGVTAIDIGTALALQRTESEPPPRLIDYSDRSGFPRPAAEMRGLASGKKERASSPLSTTAPM